MIETLETLRRDHVHIHQTLTVMKSQLNIMRSGEPADMPMLEDISGSLGQFLSAVHHPNEETALKHLAVKTPIAEDTFWLLAGEHRESEDHLAGLASALATGRCDACGSDERLMVQLGEMIERQRMFMHLEERQLFPLMACAFAGQPLVQEDTNERRQGAPGLGRRIKRRLFG